MPAPIDQNWRFAELVAQSCLQPGLRERYTAQPRAVLAEFGIRLTAGEPLPELPGAAEDIAPVSLDPWSAENAEKLQACYITYTGPSEFVPAGAHTESVAG